MSEFRRRGSQAWIALRNDGPRSLAQRALRAGYQRYGTDSLSLPVLPEDIVDSTRLGLTLPERRPLRGTPLRVGWITTPPHPRSGGHTTMFRMIEAIEQAGHTCVVYLYDRFGSDLARHVESVRASWPDVRAEVLGLPEAVRNLDACFATSWPTAHVLARRTSGQPCRRLYLVQDFEPYFYPMGAEYVLAEDTYRFGFRTITIGHMAADQIGAVSGNTSEVAPFGCDTDVYRLTNHGDRSGIAFYTKPGMPRRGFTLAALALEEFNRRHPDVEIHTYGVDRVTLPFPTTAHGTLEPNELCELFNRCVAGVAMSFTNISLIAEELLACGTIPVVNDSSMARADLDNPHVRWASATPQAIADAFSAAIAESDVPGMAAQAAASVRSTWSEGKAVAVRVLEDEVYGPDPAGLR